MLTPEQQLASCAVEVIVSVSAEVLQRCRQSSNRNRPIVSAIRLIELADEVEKQYPGWIAATRDVMAKERENARAEQDH